MNCLASQSDPKRSGNAGPYFNVLNNDSEYGLSLDTRGRECDRVTSRSASSAATVLLVIEVPRSACTTCATPCTALGDRAVVESAPPLEQQRHGWVVNAVVLVVG